MTRFTYVTLFLLILLPYLYAASIGDGSPREVDPIERNPEYTAKGFKLEGGDMLYREGFNPNEMRQGLNPDTVPCYLWDGDVLFNRDYIDDEGFAKLEDAMYMIWLTSSITFRNVSQNSTETFINVTDTDDGCYSYVGRDCRNTGNNELNLGPGCKDFGTALHELLHAMGIFHTQSRYDRDNYVKILFENIESGREHNFDKQPSYYTKNFGIGYDSCSILHYSPYAFSVSPLLPTIVSKVGSDIHYQRKGLVMSDIMLLSRMYHVDSHCPGTEDPCEGLPGTSFRNFRCRCYIEDETDYTNEACNSYTLKKLPREVPPPGIVTDEQTTPSTTTPEPTTPSTTTPEPTTPTTTTPAPTTPTTAPTTLSTTTPEPSTTKNGNALPTYNFTITSIRKSFIFPEKIGGESKSCILQLQFTQTNPGKQILAYVKSATLMPDDDNCTGNYLQLSNSRDFDNSEKHCGKIGSKSGVQGSVEEGRSLFVHIRDSGNKDEKPVYLRLKFKWEPLPVTTTPESTTTSITTPSTTTPEPTTPSTTTPEPTTPSITTLSTTTPELTTAPTTTAESNGNALPTYTFNIPNTQKSFTYPDMIGGEHKSCIIQLQFTQRTMVQVNTAIFLPEGDNYFQWNEKSEFDNVKYSGKKGIRSRIKYKIDKIEGGSLFVYIHDIDNQDNPVKLILGFRFLNE